jgi:undecaprenyl-diphosphatase
MVLFVLSRKPVYHSRFMLFEEIAQAVILGFLQGVTEFLPISSSAHLIIVPWLFGWEYFGLTFDVLVHGGTLLAILIYFNKDWKDIGTRFWNRILGHKDAQPSSLDLAVIVGTLPAIVLALVLRPVVEELARVPEVMVVTLALFGLLLGWADRKGKGDRPLLTLGPRVGFLIGLAQAIALVPGVSRAGVTITAGLLLGYSRSDAARFSFLLSGPIIALATLKGIYELALGAEAGTSSGWVLAFGVVTSLIAGLLVIKYFLRFLQSKSLMPFVYYRLGLAVVILLWIIFV